MRDREGAPESRVEGRQRPIAIGGRLPWRPRGVRQETRQDLDRTGPAHGHNARAMPQRGPVRIAAKRAGRISRRVKGGILTQDIEPGAHARFACAFTYALK